MFCELAGYYMVRFAPQLEVAEPALEVRCPDQQVQLTTSRPLKDPCLVDKLERLYSGQNTCQFREGQTGGQKNTGIGIFIGARYLCHIDRIAPLEF